MVVSELASLPDTASLVNVTLNTRYKNYKNIIADLFRQAQNATKSVFSWGCAPDPTGGQQRAYDAPPDPLVSWGGRYPSPFLFPR